MRAPKVTVIIPAYNLAQYLPKCIDSVLSQTYPAIETIVVDDGSTDDTPQVLLRYDSLISLSQKNSGVCVAKNRALDLATGEYIFFLDADDWLEPDVIERLVAAALSNDSDFVLCGYRMVDGQGRDLGSVIPTQYVPDTAEEWVYRITATLGRLYRKEFLDRYHLRFTLEGNVRAEDVPVSTFANAMAKNISVVPEAGYNYLQRSGSAYHAYRGLRHYGIPYEALQKTIDDVLRFGPVNSVDFFRFGVAKFLAQCRFQLARGASRADRKVLADFIHRNVGLHKAEYVASFRRVAGRKIDLPFYYFAAVRLLIFLA